MRGRNAITVPGEGSGPVAAVKRVFAAVLGRNDKPDDLPVGWVQFGVDGDGRPLFGYIGPRTRRWG
jgi:hypothetical protein